jgi:hypothetical protein
MQSNACQICVCMQKQTLMSYHSRYKVHHELVSKPRVDAARAGFHEVCSKDTSHNTLCNPRGIVLIVFSEFRKRFPLKLFH